MDTKYCFSVSPLINSFSLFPCPGRTLVIAGMWHQGACLSWCGWLLMGDFTPNTSVIRAADLITHRHMIICFPCASVVGRRLMCAYLPAQTWLREERAERLSVVFLFALCLFLFTPRVLREHTSVWQSVCTCEDERAGKTNWTKEEETDRERKKTKQKKTWTYSCLPVCLHLFVSLLSVCSPHSRRSALVTVFGDGEDKRGKIMCYICIIVSHKLAQRSL